jgi:hypothetical protein
MPGLRRPATTLLRIAALAAALAACGSSGSHLSADAYRKAALAACQAQAAYVRSLPELQRSQHLTVAELQQRVNERAARYLATLRLLRPPPGLEAAHRRLLADSTSGPRAPSVRPTWRRPSRESAESPSISRRSGLLRAPRQPARRSLSWSGPLRGSGAIDCALKPEDASPRRRAHRARPPTLWSNGLRP